MNAVLGSLAVVTGYSFYEPYRYRVRVLDVPLGPAGPSYDVLHLSDTHMAQHDRKLARFLEEVPEALGAEPDLIVGTGDFIEDDEGIAPFLDSVRSLSARYGSFYVLGSHDYYRSAGPAYTKYFTGGHGAPRAKRARTDDLEVGLKEQGWKPLSNATEIVETSQGRVRLSGVDDPYLDRHRTDHIERTGEDFAIGLVHAPDVVSEWLLRGFDLVVGGHTHAGQVRFPVIGAVVTNSSLPTALAGGLHRVGRGWLHISPGLGTGKYSPIRFGCRPEITLLRLRPRSSSV